MNKNIKYALVGLGVVIKLCGVPQPAHCPEIFEQELRDRPLLVPDYSKIDYNFNHYNTTNLKKYFNLYEGCEEK